VLLKNNFILNSVGIVAVMTWAVKEKPVKLGGRERFDVIAIF